MGRNKLLHHTFLLRFQFWRIYFPIPIIINIYFLYFQESLFPNIFFTLLKAPPISHFLWQLEIIVYGPNGSNLSAAKPLALSLTNYWQTKLEQISNYRKDQRIAEGGVGVEGGIVFFLMTGFEPLDIHPCNGWNWRHRAFNHFVTVSLCFPEKPWLSRPSTWYPQCHAATCSLLLLQSNWPVGQLSISTHLSS